MESPHDSHDLELSSTRSIVLTQHRLHQSQNATEFSTDADVCETAAVSLCAAAATYGIVFSRFSIRSFPRCGRDGSVLSEGSIDPPHSQRHQVSTQLSQNSNRNASKTRRRALAATAAESPRGSWPTVEFWNSVEFLKISLNFEKSGCRLVSGAGTIFECPRERHVRLRLNSPIDDQVAETGETFSRFAKPTIARLCLVGRREHRPP